MLFNLDELSLCVFSELCTPSPYNPASYVHDLIVTDNYYVLFDCPIKIDFPAVFTKYIFEKSCLSELICEDTDRRPLFRIFPRRGDSREVGAEEE